IDIQPGQFVTLLGASGSGKTTLLRMIAGFLEPTAGRIDLDGVDITSVPVHKRNIGMVFQSYALFPHMSVAKNVAFPLEMHKVRKADRARLVDEALAAVKLSGFGDRMPSQLSGGQQQRVALARAIVMRPRLLLMDEPLGALDRRLREAMQIEILRLSRELGLTVINVTHDQEEAFTMSDRIALLSDGKLVQYDAPEALYQSPVSEAAAEFLGESNRFSGILNIDGDRAWVDVGECRVSSRPPSTRARAARSSSTRASAPTSSCASHSTTPSRWPPATSSASRGVTTSWCSPLPEPERRSARHSHLRSIHHPRNTERLALLCQCPPCRSAQATSSPS
ncbi:MAG: ATP-binding cassette domain-containing protein, partial [Microbacterium sp.]